MSEAIQLDDYIDESRSDSYPSRSSASKSGGSGGDMDDVLKRLGAVESSVSELKVQVRGIAATMATKDDLNDLRVQVSGIGASIQFMATKADLSAMETRIIKWMIATVLTAVGLAFTIAKFVH